MSSCPTGTFSPSSQTTAAVACESLPHAGAAPALFGRAFVTILCVQPFLGFAFSSFLLLPKMLATQHGAGPVVIGQVASAATIAAMLAAFAGGPLIDRVGRKPLFLAGAALEALSSLAFLWVDHVGPLLFILRAIQGVGFATGFNAAGAMVVDIVPKARVGQALGLFGLAGLVNSAIAPALAEPIAARFGWTPVFILAAIAAAVACLAGALWLEEPSTERAHDEPAVHVVHPFDVYVVSMLVGLGQGAVFNFAQPFALLHGMKNVSSLFVAYTAAAVLVRGVFGSLPDKLGRRRVAVVAQVLYGAAVVLTAGLRPGWLFPIGFLLGMAHGMVYPTLAALSVERIPRHGRGLVMALLYGAFNLGVTVGQLGFGPVVERSGYPVSFLLMGALVFGGAPLIACGRAEASEAFSG